MKAHQPFGDYFTLFKLPRRYAIDLAALESAYRDVQAKIHPDRFAHLPENERRVSMQWASHANEGYRTLRKSIPRARYLLELAGHDPEIESNTAMPGDFLMQQMMLREAVEEARESGDTDALDDQLREIRNKARVLEDALAEAHDERSDYAAMALTVRQLMFLERLQEEIRGALEALET